MAFCRRWKYAVRGVYQKDGDCRQKRFFNFMKLADQTVEECLLWSFLTFKQVLLMKDVSRWEPAGNVLGATL